ncbi:hypothetical protein J6590_040629 [Homalodisca vitripennis]|nr:hypothetical protein J6590_040629 [Homalodisca vitripennis]
MSINWIFLNAIKVCLLADGDKSLLSARGVIKMSFVNGSMFVYLTAGHHENTMSYILENFQATSEACYATQGVVRYMWEIAVYLSSLKSVSGISSPRVGSDDFPLPPARHVSSKMHRDTSQKHEHGVTFMFAAWGQLTDHDLTLAAETKGNRLICSMLDQCSPFSKFVEPPCVEVARLLKPQTGSTTCPASANLLRYISLGFATNLERLSMEVIVWGRAFHNLLAITCNDLSNTAVLC